MTILKLRYFYCFIILITIISCKSNNSDADKSTYLQLVDNSTYFHEALDGLTDVIVHDIFSPPVASRIYVYPCIAAHEIFAGEQNNYPSLAGKLNGLTTIPGPKDTSNLSREIAALTAFYKIGTELIFSEEKMNLTEKRYFEKLDSLGIPEKMINSSKEYGTEVAAHILAWAKQDNYNQTRSFSKFSISDDPARWKPTPPAYMEGIEPHWNQIRTMVLDSASQFRILPPPPFDLKEGSDFREKTMEVYDVVNKITKDQKEIASFWDCNPFVMNQTGHIMFATKKITPGGHWMGISNIASEKQNLSLPNSVRTSTLVAISLFDGFIACWDEKYRSSLVRPETVINEFIDEDWIPVLQTPPFPEHTSGHSVISTAAATTLTALFGDSFAFVDDVETKYGLGIRAFESFKAASAEAAISRLYGGIHYMPAITEGVLQGEKVGELVVERLDLKKLNHQ